MDHLGNLKPLLEAVVKMKRQISDLNASINDAVKDELEKYNESVTEDEQLKPSQIKKAAAMIIAAENMAESVDNKIDAQQAQLDKTISLVNLYEDA